MVMCVMRATCESPACGGMILFNLWRRKYTKDGLVKLSRHGLLFSKHKKSESRTREAESCYGTTGFVRLYISSVFTGQILLVCGRNPRKSLSLLPFDKLYT
jgi:hypothetical protein